MPDYFEDVEASIAEDAGHFVHYETPDPEINLDVVAGEPRYGDFKYAINNSFGFGGHNVALAFGRY